MLRISTATKRPSPIFEELLRTALNSTHGIAVRSPDPARLRTQLNVTRTNLRDREYCVDFDDLLFTFSPYNPDAVWILHRSQLTVEKKKPHRLDKILDGLTIDDEDVNV